MVHGAILFRDLEACAVVFFVRLDTAKHYV